jgi:hypothetical protein
MALEAVPAALRRALARLGRSETFKGALVGLAAGALVVPLFFLNDRTPVRTPQIASPPPAPHVVRRADFGDEAASGDVRTIADWIAATDDAGGGPFVVIDKKFARLHVFDSDARLVASSPILLGGARGDDTVPGIGDRPIELVKPEERTTPAGRFVGERGMNARGEDVVWVDYDAAVSMHRVLTTEPKERRLERLATPTWEDNRISWGCINVPVAFYEAQVRPMFATRKAIVYVLPEVKTLAEVFHTGTAGGAGVGMQEAMFSHRAPVQDTLP